jgi:hypothetical protein
MGLKDKNTFGSSKKNQIILWWPHVTPTRRSTRPSVVQACARYGSEELVAGARCRFLAAGGEKVWLEGLHRAPPKLRRLATINRVLAHRPWALDQAHLKELTTGQDSWSLAEIVQAIGEIPYLSSFVLSYSICFYFLLLLRVTCVVVLSGGPDTTENFSADLDPVRICMRIQAFSKTGFCYLLLLKKT